MEVQNLLQVAALQVAVVQFIHAGTARLTR